MRVGDRRRLLLLVIVLVLASGGGLYLHRERSLDAAARVARDAGVAAFEGHDYPLAVQKLAQFIRRLEPDALALLRYAQAVRALSNPDAQHLESALASLRRAVGQQPTYMEARRELLELYLLVGARTEALEQAEWLLAKDGEDEQAVRVKAVTLTAMKRFDAALRVLESSIRVDTPRLEEQLLYVTVLASLKRPVAEILDRARRVEEANHGDARFKLVGARARLVTDDVVGAKAALKLLVSSAPTDVGYARLLVPNLDAANLPREAVAVLVNLLPSDLDAGLQGELIRRLWESGDATAVVDNVARWRIAPDHLTTSVLGYHALALGRLQRREDAGRIIGVLKGRRDDVTAKGWVRLLESVVLADTPTISRRIAGCLRSIEADPGIPPARLELGLAYRDAGEVDLAVREFREAAKLSGGWATPVALGARLLAENGRLPAALGAAMAAEARGSDDPGVAFLLGLVRRATDRGAGRSFSDRVLESWAQAGLSSSETLPVRLAIIAASGRPDMVKALIEEVLSPDARPEGEVLIACAMLSQARGFGVEAQCLARYETLYGSTPALALALARQSAATNGGTSALGILRARRASTNGERAAEWLAAESTYLESSATPEEALQSWRRAVEASIGDPGLLRAALDAASTWRDREFVRSTIDHLKSATDTSCLWWRFYDARWTLTAPSPSAGSLDSSIQQLRGILEIAPQHLRARLLLASAYEVRGDGQKALEQLIIAKQTLGSSTALDLRIARLHLRIGDWTSALELLKRVMANSGAGNSAFSPEQQLAMAAMFARLGERSTVLALLGQDGGRPSNEDETLGRAELYAATGEFDRAQKILGSVSSPEGSPQALLLAAALADFQGQTAEEERLLGLLVAATPNALKRERLLAEHFARVGNVGRAEGHWSTAVALDGSTVDDWRELLACQVIQGKVEELATTLDRARGRGAFASKDGGDAISADVLRAAASRADLRALGAAYLQDESRRAVAAQAIRLLDAADRVEPSVTDRARLHALTQQNPTFLPLQMAMADLLVRRREFDEATALCKAAAATFPVAAEPARAMAYCYRMTGQLRAAADAAKEWRSRTSGTPLEPDLFLAEQSPPAEAVALLETYIPRALERGMSDVLVAYGRARILEGETSSVQALLEPHLASAAVAVAWVRLANFGATRREAKAFATWLDRDEVRAAAATSPRLTIELAGAWATIGLSAADVGARENSRRLLSSLKESTTLAASDWERIGLIHESNADVGLAESAYRRAISSEPRPLVAVNNLAMILARTGRAGDAAPLAETLVARRPDIPAYRDTLAFVQLQGGHVIRALAQLEEARKLEPGNASWAVRIVQVMLDHGDREGAATRFEAFRRDYPVDRLSPELRVKWSALSDALRSSDGSARPR